MKIYMMVGTHACMVGNENTVEQWLFLPIEWKHLKVYELLRVGDSDDSIKIIRLPDDTPISG